MDAKVAAAEIILRQNKSGLFFISNLQCYTNMTNNNDEGKRILYAIKKTLISSLKHEV